MQVFDLKDFRHTGANEVTLDVKGETGAMYQIVGRHYEPWATRSRRPSRFWKCQSITTGRSSPRPTCWKRRRRWEVQRQGADGDGDAGPGHSATGFSADAGDFAEIEWGRRRYRSSAWTERQAILYLGDVEPNKTYQFKYTLRPKYPVKAKTPVSTAYEYYTPLRRADGEPVELVVDEARK